MALASPARPTTPFSTICHFSLQYFFLKKLRPLPLVVISAFWPWVAQAKWPGPPHVKRSWLDANTENRCLENNETFPEKLLVLLKVPLKVPLKVLLMLLLLKFLLKVPLKVLLMLLLLKFLLKVSLKVLLMLLLLKLLLKV